MPTILKEGVKYYTISYLTNKVLLRNDQGLINKNNKKKYENYIKKFEIKYGEKNIQETNCISEEGLKLVLSNSEPSRLDNKKRKALNGLLEYFKLPLVSEKERVISLLSEKELNLHDEYVKDIIIKFINTYEGKRKLKYQLCFKCGLYYPQHKNFFHMLSNGMYEKTCKNCYHRYNINNDNNLSKELYNKYGENGYKIYKEHDVISIYKFYIDSKRNDILHEIYNKNDYLEIIKYLYDGKIINNDNISIKILSENFKLKNIKKIIKISEVYKYLFGDNFYLYPWKYKSFRFDEIKLTYELANKILTNYINEYNISIKDIFNYDYNKICDNARITKVTQRDILSFIVQYYNYEYPGYKFKISSVNYYNDINNRKHDLIYLVEKELKLQIEKIPLYITKTFLNRNYGSLYNMLNKYYKSSIFEWVNETYPDRFIREDFDISIIRNEFDSEEERVIYEILKNKFKNVLYNKSRTKYTINLQGNIPDYFVFTKNGVWLIEYYGLYVDNINNKRVSEYRQRTNYKIEKYKEFNGYNFIYLYPKDLNNNCEELCKKIEIIY